MSIRTAWDVYKKLELREHMPKKTRQRIALSTLGNPRIERIIDTFDRELEPLSEFAEVLSTYPDPQIEDEDSNPIRRINSRIPWNVMNLGTFDENTPLHNIMHNIAGYIVLQCEEYTEHQELFRNQLLIDKILYSEAWKLAWRSFEQTRRELRIDSMNRDELEKAIRASTHIVTPTGIAESINTRDENILINHFPDVVERVRHSERWTERTFMLWISQFESLLATAEPTKSPALRSLLESIKQINGFRERPAHEQHDLAERLLKIAENSALTVVKNPIEHLLLLGAPEVSEIPLLLSTTWEYLMNSHDYQYGTPLSLQQLQQAVAFVENRKRDFPYHVYDHILRELSKKCPRQST